MPEAADSWSLNRSVALSPIGSFSTTAECVWRSDVSRIRWRLPVFVFWLQLQTHRFGSSSEELQQDFSRRKWCFLCCYEQQRPKEYDVFSALIFRQFIYLLSVKTHICASHAQRYISCTHTLQAACPTAGWLLCNNLTGFSSFPVSGCVTENQASVSTSDIRKQTLTCVCVCVCVCVLNLLMLRKHQFVDTLAQL